MKENGDAHEGTQVEFKVSEHAIARYSDFFSGGLNWIGPTWTVFIWMLNDLVLLNALIRGISTRKI